MVDPAPRVHTLDPRRIAWRTLLGSLIVLSLVAAEQGIHGDYGGDFVHGIWLAGWHVLHGGSPYPPANPHVLLRLVSGFVTPPPIADVAAPFTLLPRQGALALWNSMDVLALPTALWILGVRRPVIFLLALTSEGMLDSLTWGQPDALYALALAVAWRYRDSPGGAIALGWVIAAKLLVFPLLLWLAMTRRYRQLLIACSAIVAWLVLSWATVGFAGLGAYPKLLSSDASAFEGLSVSLSVVGRLVHAGVSVPMAQLAACSAAIAFLLATIWLARHSDEGIFTACIAAGLLASPIMWFHYLVLLLVPMAITRRDRTLIWVILSPMLLFVLRTAIPPTITLRWAAVCYVVGISVACAARRRVPFFLHRRAEPTPSSAQMATRSSSA